VARDPSVMVPTGSWPVSAAELRRGQEELATACPPRWHVPAGAYVIGGCFVCFSPRSRGPGLAGEPGWAGATVALGEHIVSSVSVAGVAGGAYEPGLLALREGPLLEAAVRALPRMPEVLLVNATGRDHPRRAGLALHLGAVLGVPTVGVTHRPLLACGAWPSAERGSRSPLQLGGRPVGCWIRTRTRARPLAVHLGWRTDLDTLAPWSLTALGACGRRRRCGRPDGQCGWLGRVRGSRQPDAVVAHELREAGS
jgi:deoxyribonuclease V